MNLAQNVAQFCAQFHTQNSKCLLNCTPEGGRDLSLLEALAGEPLLPPHEAREGHVPQPDEGGHDAGAVPEDAPRPPEVAVLAVLALAGFGFFPLLPPVGDLEGDPPDLLELVRWQALFVEGQLERGIQLETCTVCKLRI